MLIAYLSNFSRIIFTHIYDFHRHGVITFFFVCFQCTNEEISISLNGLLNYPNAVAWFVMLFCVFFLSLLAHTQKKDSYCAIRCSSSSNSNISSIFHWRWNERVYHIWATLELGNRYENREKWKTSRFPKRQSRFNLTGMKVSLFNLFVTLRYFLYDIERKQLCSLCVLLLLLLLQHFLISKIDR